MDCPNCGLINPDGAERCDCGFDFHSRRVVNPVTAPEAQPAPRSALNGLSGWLTLVALGLLVSPLLKMDL